MINLYENITPNHTSTHYIFSDFSKYLQFLETKLLKSVAPTNYTIDNLFLRVKIDTVLTASNYKNVTYIINTTDEVCYQVDSAKIHSGYVFFNIRVDNWGTYLHKASLKDILIRRCNRKINDNGVYDKISNVDEEYTEELVKIYDDFYDFEYKDKFSASRMVVIAVVKISEKIRMLGIPLNSDYITASGLTVLPQDVQNYVSGIHQAKTDNGTLTDATLISTYFVPFVFISQSYSSGGASIKSSVGGDHELNCLQIYPQQRKINLELNNHNNNDLVCLGTYNSLIPLLRRTFNENSNLHKYFLRVLITLNEIKVMLLNGNNNSLDITTSFSFTSTSYGENYKSTDKISSALGYFKGVAQLGVGIFGGSPLSIVRGISSITQQITSDITPYPTTLIGGGDAFSNMKINSSLEYESPIRIIYYSSLMDENKRIRKIGATFNTYVDNLSTVFTFNLLGTGQTTDDTFIQADIEINNIPLDAINDITGKLGNGVHTQQLL